MAIVTKKKVVAKRESSFTHFPNETTAPVEEQEQEARNHQQPEMLIDPEDDEGGSTHFNNEEKYNKKSKMQNGGSTTASKRLLAKKAKPVPLAPVSKKKPVKAEMDPDGDFDLEDEDSGIEAASQEVESLRAEDQESGQQDTQHFDNDIDPTDGYLTVGEFDDEDGNEEETSDEELEEDDDEVNADVAEDELNVGDTPQSFLEYDDGDEPTVAEFEDEEEEDEDEDEPEEMQAGADDMSILDVDGTDDEGDDAVFAAVGTSLKVIKGNRIIAYMGKKVAAKAGHEDIYLSDQFQEVASVEMSKHGLRAGLKKMGFVLATVDMGKSEVINKRVDAKAQKLTAAVRRASYSTNETLKQCMAIAAVGINRQYFNDVRNELRASLEEELQAAGVRGATKLVRRVFASKGISYAHSIVELANKLQSMPEVARNAFASALDMVGEGSEEMDDEDNLYGDSANPDFQAEFSSAEEGEDEFEDGVEDDMDEPSTVHAALARPIHKKQQVKASSTGYSARAMAILNGNAPFPFK